MSERPKRRALIQRLLDAVCRSAVWSTDPSAPVKERLAAALSAHHLELTALGTTLSAWVSDDVELLIRIRITQGFNTGVQDALRTALREDGSVLAALLLAEWTDLCWACESAYRDSSPGQRAT